MTDSTAPDDAYLRACGWPDYLIKATRDEFNYLVVLRDGERVMVEHVTESETPGWCVLHLLENWVIGRNIPKGAYGFPCPRGLEVRVADIVAIADAPEGS